MTHKRFYTTDLKLGDTSEYGVAKEKYPAYNKAQSDRVRTFVDYLNKYKSDTQTIQAEQLVDAYRVIVQHGSGKANPNLRSLVEKNWRNVEMTTVSTPNFQDIYTLPFLTPNDILKTRLCLKLFGIFIIFIIIIVCVYILFLINPYRYDINLLKAFLP
jgi:hypothetical protein